MNALFLWLPIAVALSLPIASASAQQGREEKPAWVLYRQGIVALQERRLGEALLLFRSALERRTPYPEAEAGIGMIYEADGLPDLAERQYLRSLERQDFFAIPEEGVAVRYRLATLYLQRADRRAYEDILLSITAEDPLFSSPEQEGLRRAMLDTLLKDGIDRVVLLYRNDHLASLEAHLRLGEHFVANGNYTPALIHLLIANLQVVGALIEHLRHDDPDYRFGDLNRLLDIVSGDKELHTFAFIETDLNRLLYYLAASIYGHDPSSATWRALWIMIAERSDAEPWARLARLQLQSPRIEPFVDF